VGGQIRCRRYEEVWEGAGGWKVGSGGRKRAEPLSYMPSNPPGLELFAPLLDDVARLLAARHGVVPGAQVVGDLHRVPGPSILGGSLQGQARDVIVRSEGQLNGSAGLPAVGGIGTVRTTAITASCSWLS
jgi:hypothetical protein